MCVHQKQKRDEGLTEPCEVAHVELKVVTNRFGRVVSTVRAGNGATRDKTGESKAKGEEGSCEGNGAEQAGEGNSTPKATPALLIEDHNDWYCSVCMVRACFPDRCALRRTRT